MAAALVSSLLFACRSQEVLVTPEPDHPPRQAPPAPAEPLPPAPQLGNLEITWEDRSLAGFEESEREPLVLTIKAQLKDPSRYKEISALILSLPDAFPPIRLGRSALERRWQPRQKAFLWETPVPMKTVPLGEISCRLEAENCRPTEWKGLLRGRGFHRGKLFTAPEDEDEVIILKPPYQMNAANQGDMLMVYFDTRDKFITHMEFLLYEEEGRAIARSPLYRALKPRGTNSYLMDPLDFPRLPGFSQVKAIRILPYSIIQEGILTLRYRLVSPAVPVE